MFAGDAVRRGAAVAYEQSTAWPLVVTSLVVHILFFGIPLAWMDRWLRSAGPGAEPSAASP